MNRKSYSVPIVMHLIKFVFSFIILGVTEANREEFEYFEKKLQGSCPKVKYITNFDLPRLIGWWYRDYSTPKFPECLDNEGQTIYAAEYDDTSLNLQGCCRSAANPTIATCGNKVGSGTVTFLPNTGDPASMVYQFGNSSYPIYILDTDYTNFVIVYGCKPVSERPTERDELIIVLSRDYELTVSFRNRVNGVLKRNDADLSKGERVKQGPRIPYTPGQKPCDCEAFSAPL